MSVTGIKCFVHITSKERPGFVEFNFSINDPGIFLEMILPTAAFSEFCKDNDVIFLTPEEINLVEEEQKKWRFGLTEGIDIVHNNS